MDNANPQVMNSSIGELFPVVGFPNNVLANSTVDPTSHDNDSNLANGSDVNYNWTYDYDAEMQGNLLFYYYLWTFVAPIIFATITIVGTSGNALVIYVILSRNSMQTVTNFLLLNLAIADIAFLLICVPFTAYKYVAYSWPFGDLACKLVGYFLYVSAYVTVYTLVAISAFRYITVVCSHTTAQYRTKKNVIILNMCIWLIMLAANVPTLISHRTKNYSADYSYCGMYDVAVGPVFVTFFVFAYGLPLFIICLLYLLIMRHLQRHNKSSTVEHTRDRTARACRVIILVVVVFGVSWLPLHVNSLVAKYGSLPTGAYYEVFRILWNSLAYGNSCVNPIIYNYASQEFRKSFREVICCYSFFNRRRNVTRDRVSLSETLTMV